VTPPWPRRPPARTALLLFAGTALLLGAASPLWLASMGYAAEELAACRQILDGGAVAWPRNGVVSLALELPLLAAARALGARPAAGEEVLASLAPVLATAAITAILFVWASRLSRSRSWGLALALAATFSTMLWPYAYIGLETLQSLLLLAAAWTALEAPDRVPSWARSLAFGLLAGAAVSAKSTGFLLWPAAAYLAWRLFGRGGRAVVPRALVSLGLAAAIHAANSAARNASWSRFGGMTRYGSDWLVTDAASPILNLVALLASPNKGLLVFAPLAVLGLLALPRAWRRARPVAVFALLTLGGIAAGISILGIWSDETWGPRYLHAAVAPLVLVFAAGRAGRAPRLRTEAPFAAAAAAGFVVSALGVLFYYGSLSSAARRVTTPTLESLQGDPTWNHVRFNGLLARSWLAGNARPLYIAPERVWDFDDPHRPLEWKAVDLRRFAEPQPRLLASAHNPSERALRWAGVAAALLGMLVLEAARRARWAPGAAAGAASKPESSVGGIIPADP
jgi:hypothetical protein